MMHEDWDRDFAASGMKLREQDGVPSCEIEDRPGGVGYLTGFLGALAGALLGAVPWFLVSAFAGFFVGWLGFLVGWAACLGYRICRGAKRTGYAMTVIVLCAAAAIVASDFASNMYMLCTDADWQYTAARYGISVYLLAADSLMKENLRYILPNLLMGLLIGGVGILAARKQVIQYTDPQKYRAMEERTAAAMHTAGAAAQVPEGMELPQRFTVSQGKALMVLGVVFLVMFIPMLGISLLSISDGYGVLVLLPFLPILLVGVWLMLLGRRRIEVDGESLLSVSAFGKKTEFHASEIGGVFFGPPAGMNKLYGRDGALLAKYASNAKNTALFARYLQDHQVPLRAE